MKIKPTNINGCLLIEPPVFKDNRGYFLESFNQKSLLEHSGIQTQFVQDNESMSNFGVIRGLHIQKGKFSQAKLVRVVQGKVLDVVVDVRMESPTFGEIFTQEISAKNKLQMFIPKGCLHGFSVLENQTIFSYKCDEYYHPESETGVNPLDPILNINWGIEPSKALISEKDLKLHSWVNYINKMSIAAMY
ncbi:MAG: dTDP-4-dehydrorhamnose 3,5-epimerase [Cecembia sp.]